MGKKSYRIGDVKKIRVEDLKAGLGTSKRAVLAGDVAKSEVVVSVGGDDAESVVVFKVKQPAELPKLFEVATELQTSGYRVEIVAESTGTYSDVLAYQAHKHGFPMYQVSTKFVHDAKELHDGVPSKHDAKDATLLLWLHVRGKSRPWPERGEAQRRAKAVVSRRQLQVEAYVANAGRLEALLARHWPELLALGAVIGVLLLKLLQAVPSPRLIVEDPERVRGMLRRYPSAEAREAIAASAAASQGVEMIEEEETVMRELAGQMLTQRREIERIDKELREMLQRDPVAARVAAVVGPTTAMVLAADLGDLSTYARGQATQKAAGLNLREHSSGTMKSGLHITKRGPPRVRQYLYLATMRLLKNDPIVRAWYARHVAHGQPKMSAMIAVMRKLTRALPFVARGEAFQASKLFDVRRLDLPKDTSVEVTPTLAEALQLDERSVSEPTDSPEEKPQENAAVARKSDKEQSPREEHRQEGTPVDIPRPPSATRPLEERSASSPRTTTEEELGVSAHTPITAEKNEEAHGSTRGRRASSGAGRHREEAAKSRRKDRRASVTTVPPVSLPRASRAQGATVDEGAVLG